MEFEKIAEMTLEAMRGGPVLSLSPERSKLLIAAALEQTWIAAIECCADFIEKESNKVPGEIDVELMNCAAAIRVTLAARGA